MQLFASLLKNHFHAEIKTTVGREGAEYMTKNRFLGLVRFVRRHCIHYVWRVYNVFNTNRTSFTFTGDLQVKRDLLEQEPPTGPRGKTPDYYALYVLYFAGHGDEPDGHFCVEKRQTVTLDDILAVWAASAPYKAGGSRLLIVADSCFSGRMAARLRDICTRPGQRANRQAEAARMVAVQAACGYDELAWDGCFTSRYVNEVSLFQLYAFGLGFACACAQPWGQKKYEADPSNARLSQTTLDLQGPDRSAAPPALPHDALPHRDAAPRVLLPLGRDRDRHGAQGQDLPPLRGLRRTGVIVRD